MKRVLIIFLSISVIFISAQSGPISISEVDLPAPNKLSIFNLPAALKKHILYGNLPVNNQGIVLVFTHGLGNTADVFFNSPGLFQKNNLYETTYKAGYLSVFVTTSPYNGDWENGEYLDRALKQIRNKYPKNPIVLIAHGAGGRAAEVAMYKYDANKIVSKIITLGTPFLGTPLSDIAQDPDHEWVINNGVWATGTKLTTTYYTQSYFRPYFDNHQRNEGERFYTFGAWNYSSKKGNHSKKLVEWGRLIAAYDKGFDDNDGITPYISSIRPGSNVIGAVKDPRGDINHDDLVQGKSVWRNIILPNLFKIDPILPLKENKNTSFSKVSDNIYQSISNYQIISSANKSAYAWITSKTKEVEVDILYDKSDSDISFLGSNSKLILKGIKKSNSLKSEAHTSLRLQGGENFRIQSQGNYLAFIKDGLDQPMIYQVKKLGNKTFLELNFPNLPTTKLKSLSLTASLSYLGDLEGRGNRGSKESVFFKEDSGKYILDVSNHIKGIYNITIQAEIPNEYRRSLITGFVLTEDGSTISDSNVATDKLSTLDYQLIGNPVSKSTVLKLPVGLLGKVSLKVYDMQGSLVKDFQVTANTLISIGSYLYQLPKGAYVLTIQTGKGTKNINFIK